MWSSLEHWLARRVLQVVGDPAVKLELADGFAAAAPRAETSPIEIHLHDRASLFRLLYKPTRSFGDLYASGRLTVNTDMVDVLDTLYTEIQRLEREGGSWRRLARRVFDREPRNNSLKGSRRNIHRHYDLSNEFYELWLDPEYMQYTCAYYPSPNVTLQQAQIAKLDLICRKLALAPGERVVEAGGGWGGLARYFARHHGVHVTSYNISHEQVAYATQRAKAEGLEDRITYVEDDYRNIKGDYDVFVSVGMLEHVGLRNYPALGAVMDGCLTDAGRGLVHSIGQNRARRLNEWIEANIFPGAYPPTLRQMTTLFEPFGLSIVDVENLRAHYAQTLIDWRDHFERNVDRVAARFDDRFVRAWRLYLSGSISAFRTGQLQLYQVLFERQNANVLPITRNRMLTGP